MLDCTADISGLDVSQLQAIVTKYPWFSYAREVLLYKLVEIEPQCFQSKYKEMLVFFPKRESVYLKCRQIMAARPADAVEVPAVQLMDVPETVPVLEAEEEKTGCDVELQQMPEKVVAIEAKIVEIAAEEQVCANEVEPLEELSLEMDFSSGSSMPASGSDFDVVLEKESVEPVMEIQPSKPKIVVVGGDYFSKDDFAQLDEGEKVAEIRLGAPADNMEHETSGGESDLLDFDSLDFVTETLAKIYADQGYYDKAIEVYAKLILLYPEKSTYFATLVNEIKSKN